MREPRMVEAAIRPPGHCFICGGIEGRMVDTMVDVVGDGRFYICERICLPLIARAAGYATPAEVADWYGRIQELNGKADELGRLLEEAEDAKVVPLSEVVAALRKSQAKTAKAEAAS